MMKISGGQQAAIGDDIFLSRLRRSLTRTDVDFAAMAPKAQDEFLVAAVARAREIPFRTEQGVAAYVLGALWLGVGFEADSSLLSRLLAARLPEIRKVHAMGEWVRDRLGPHATEASGDAALRRSFALTEPWGRSGA
jgi:hypothetical protein